MDINMQLLPLNHRLRLTEKYPKTSITIHSTANPKSTAQNERDWLDNPTNKRVASWHFVVDEIEVIQSILTSESSMHSGTAKSQHHSVSVEICESGDRRKTLERASEFVAFLLKTMNLQIKDITTHNAWIGKNCPRILIDKDYIVNGMDWNYFIGRVEHYFNGEDEEDMVRYNTISEVIKEMPYARATIQKLIDLKMFADKDKLDLSKDMIRVFVLNDRIGLYDKKL